MRHDGAAFRLFQYVVDGPILTLHVIVCLLLVMVFLMQLFPGEGEMLWRRWLERLAPETYHVLPEGYIFVCAFFAITLLLAIAYSQKGKGANACAARTPESGGVCRHSGGAGVSASTPAEAAAPAQPSPEATASPSSTPAPTTPSGDC